MISRRAFIQTGLLGAVALAVAGGLYRFTRSPPAQRFRLDTGATPVLAAIVPVMLKEVLAATDPAAIAATIMRTQTAIGSLPLRAQKEVADLFGLLTLGPTRRLLAGVPDDWPSAKPEDVGAFLQNWRVHRFKMLQSAYQALHDLIIGAWYSDESTWPAIGYPGPISLPA